MVERLTGIVWLMFFGVCFASLYAYWQRSLVGGVVRALLKAEATSPDNAKTLDEIGYADRVKKAFATRILRHGASLRRTVKVLYDDTPEKKKNDDELFSSKKKLDCEQKYYIPEEVKYIADVRYEAEGTSAKTLLLSVIAMFIAAVIIVSALPDAVRMLDGVKSNLTRGENTGYTEQIHKSTGYGEN